MFITCETPDQRVEYSDTNNGNNLCFMHAVKRAMAGKFIDVAITTDPYKDCIDCEREASTETLYRLRKGTTETE